MSLGMNRFVLLALLACGLFLAGLLTMQGAMLALVLPLLVFLGAAFFFSRASAFRITDFFFADFVFFRADFLAARAFKTCSSVSPISAGLSTT